MNARRRSTRDTGAEARALAAWRQALPGTAMRELAGAGYDEAARLAWIRRTAPRMEHEDAADMAADAYISDAPQGHLT